MHIRNKEWRIEVDKKKDIVTLYAADREKLIMQTSVTEFICLGALIEQVKGAAQ